MNRDDSLFSSTSVIPALSASNSILNFDSSWSSLRKCRSTCKAFLQTIHIRVINSEKNVITNRIVQTLIELICTQNFIFIEHICLRHSILTDVLRGALHATMSLKIGSIHIWLVEQRSIASGHQPDWYAAFRKVPSSVLLSSPHTPKTSMMSSTQWLTTCNLMIHRWTRRPLFRHLVHAVRSLRLAYCPFNVGVQHGVFRWIQTRHNLYTLDRLRSCNVLKQPTSASTSMMTPLYNKQAFILLFTQQKIKYEAVLTTKERM